MTGSGKGDAGFDAGSHGLRWRRVLPIAAGAGLLAPAVIGIPVFLMSCSQRPKSVDPEPQPKAREVADQPAPAPPPTGAAGTPAAPTVAESAPTKRTQTRQPRARRMPKEVPPADISPPPKLQSNDPAIAEALKSVQSAKLPVCVRFEEHGSDIIAYLNPGVTTERRTAGTREIKLPAGRGVPLAELPRSLEVKKPPAGTRKLLDQFEERGKHRVAILKMTDDRKQIVSFRKLLWSPDGKVLYGLTDRNGLMRIDADTWEVTAEYHPWTPELGFRDIAWSSAGLIGMEAGGLDDSSRRTPWICLQPGEPPIRNHPSFRLMVLDPETLSTRHSWYVWGDRVAGHPKSGHVYVSFNRAPFSPERGHLFVIDAARGELLNAIDGNLLRPADDVVRKRDIGESGWLSPGVSIDCPEVSPDGKWLLTLPERRGDHPDLSEPVEFTRFRIEGAHLACEQRIRNLVKDQNTPIKLTGDSRYVCTSDHREPGYFLLDLTNFSRTVGSVDTYSTGGAFAIDSDAKTAYIQRTFVPVETGRGPPANWKFSIEVVQDGRSESIPWHGNVGDLVIRPAHRGVFVQPQPGPETNCYWIEHPTAGHVWPFEQKPPVGPTSK